VLVTSIILAV